MQDFDENLAVSESLGVINDGRPEKLHPPEPPHREDLNHVSVEDLVRRLRALKERIGRLQFVFTTTLSREVSHEIDQRRSPPLQDSIFKLAMAGEQTGFSVEQMIWLLNAGVTLEGLLRLVEWRLSPPEQSACSSR